MMNFVLKTTNCVSQTRSYVSKTRNVVLKMMIILQVGEHHGGDYLAELPDERY